MKLISVYCYVQPVISGYTIRKQQYNCEEDWYPTEAHNLSK